MKKKMNICPAIFPMPVILIATYNDDGSVLESVVLCAKEGRYGVDIPKNVWHNVE